MKATVLRAFLYSDDGVLARALDVGQEFDCRGDLTAGLLAEGFIARAEIDAPAAETRAIRPDPSGGPHMAVKAPRTHPTTRRDPRR